MPTTTTKDTQTSNVQNIPSQFQNEGWGGLWGAASGLIWPGGNFGLAPQYPGQMTAPQGQQTQNWYSNVNNMKTPDFSGVMDINGQLESQVYNRMQNVGDIGIQGNYTPQQFQVNPLQFNDPFAGYNGGGLGMQIQPGGGVGGKASDYQTAVQQVQAPQGVSYDRISGLPQVQAPNLQNYQMGPAQQVTAPGGLNSFQLNDPQQVHAGTVGTQSWTAPGTSQQYMSPYTQNVLDAQKANMTADYNKQLTQQHAQAAQAGAFGGSRQAVEDAEATRNLNLQMQNVEAQGLQSAYQQGAQQFNTEQGLGLQGQQFNQQLGMQAGLANQQAGLQTSLANQQAALAAQGLGTTTGMQAALANQQAGLTVGGQNLQALLQTQGLGAQLGMQGQLANQQMAYNQQLANQQAGLQAGEFNNTQAMQAQQLNQAANLQAGLNATNLGFQGATFNAGQNMQAQLANQQAQQAMFQRQYGALGQQYTGGLQAGLQGQQLGMTAQQLGMQSNQFGAGLDLQSQVAQQQARQAAQNTNLNYMQLGNNINQQNGAWQQMGFQNDVTNTGLMQGTALNQQGYDQAAADRAYQDWMRQQNYPLQMLNFGAGIMSQMPAQGSVQSTQQGVNYTTTPGPSPWNIAAGLASTAVGGFTGGFGAGMGGGLAKQFLG
jgi:hypothetical protein